MIFATGDTHIPFDINKLNISRFPQQKELTTDDYLVICGDFGGVWDNSSEEKYWLKWFNNKKFTTLFIDGNHENHRRLNEEFPIIDFHGGKAHKIGNRVFHLMRGQVFNLDEKKIFAMGGARSHDCSFRKEGKNWWQEELPSEAEYSEAIKNLNSNGWKVDIVFSHCAPNSIQNRITEVYETNKLTCFLEEVKDRLEYEKWYFGHYHIDRDFDEKHLCLFNRIVLVI